MTTQGSLTSRIPLMLLALLLGVPLAPAAFAAPAQDPADKPPADKQGSDAKAKAEPVTIHIEVTAGEKDKPVEGASVYVRYNEVHKIRSDKLIEMNVKTSINGKVKVPLVPKGKILIQVIAEGWKTYGRWFDLTEDGQVFKIHLDRPPHWY